MPALNQYMFREYDIRGRETDEELNPASILLIAKAYGTFLRKRNITTTVVGHDNRVSSESFYHSAIEGLRSVGVDVIGIGMCLTPHMYWSQYHFKTEGGLMVTASHNPAGWNGVKLALGYSYTLIGDELKEIKDIAESESFSTGAGSLKEENIFEKYMADVLGRVKLQRPIKVLLNTANATSSFFSPDLLRKFGCEVVEYNTDPDPTYPHYVPNPANIEMMEDTGRQVVKVGADIGIGIDADGDRLGITDEKGNIIWPDRWLILLSRQILEKKPGAKIVFDVKVSESLPEDIEAHGGVPVMWKTGHAYMKQKMKEVGAVFAGEQSGHVYYQDGYYGFDDANFAALKLLEYISAHARPVSELIQDAPTYVSTPAYHAHVEDAVKYSVVEKLTEQFKSEGYKVIDINGARVYMHDGWGLIRATSNLPAVVLRFEAKTQEGLDKIEQLFKDKLSQFPEVSTTWESA